jgi:iron(III) transport system substrate-binding protein
MKWWTKAAASMAAIAPVVAGVAYTPASQTVSAQTLHLVFYSAQGYDAAEAAAFQKATGIKVELSDMSTGPLLARVAAQAQNPQWDVIWFDGNEPMAVMNHQHQLLTGWTPASARYYNSLGKSLLPANHGYFPTGVSAAAAIAYNTHQVTAAQAPKTWQALLSPKWKNKIAMNNPAISGPTYPFVAGIFKLMGPSKAEAYFKGLRANGLHTHSTNGATLGALEAGSVKIALAQDSAIRFDMSQGAHIGIVYPKPVVMLPSDVAINAKAPDMKAAKEFVNFVLSKKGQQVMQDWKAAGGDSYFQPVTTEIKPLISRTGVDWLNVNPLWGGEHQAAWTNWFTNNVVR